MTSDARIPCVTVPLTVQFDAVDGTEVRHELAVSLAYHDGRLHELCFVTRGKIGQGLDAMLSDLGIKLSRAIQGRDPETGETL